MKFCTQSSDLLELALANWDLQNYSVLVLLGIYILISTLVLGVVLWVLVHMRFLSPCILLISDIVLYMYVYIILYSPLSKLLQSFKS